MATKAGVTEWRRRAAEETGCLLFEATAEGAKEGRTMFFAQPQRVLEARAGAEMPGLLRDLDEALEAGLWVAGYVTYEGACALLGVKGARSDGPLAWFGVYDAPAVAGGGTATSEPAKRFPLCLEMEVIREEYLSRVRRVQAWLEEGQSYQMNLTTGVGCGWRGDALELYEALAAAQPSAYSALLHTAEEEWVLSFSPEMLFRMEASGRLLTRPMKGTAPADAETGWLAADEKNRAEHVMIVDLLRNDVGRVCEAGSVQVEEMFAVEQHRTLQQMTSTVSGRLKAGVGLGAVMQAMLPAGSMTGAPKRRTVELLRELEGAPRGVYSGAIGFAGPDGTAAFSVPIRTLTIAGKRLRMGVGGGVVADSTPEDELAECWLKARFLMGVGEPFQVLETMQWDGSGYLWLNEHMDRLGPSAERLGYPFDRTAVVEQLDEFGRGLGGPRRVRLKLGQSGHLHLEDLELMLWKEPVTMGFAQEPIWSGDSFLAHKTTFRPVYDRELRRAQQEGFQDLLFVNERGELTEGAISSVLLLLDGQWVTPMLAAGLLPGVARGILLRNGDVTERALLEADLERAEALVMVNGVRGIAQVRTLQLRSGRRLEWERMSSLPQLR